MVNKNLDCPTLNNKKLSTNSMNIRRDLERTLNNLRPLRGEFNSLLLKTLDLERSFTVFKKTFDFQPNSSKNFLVKSINIKNRLLKTILNQKLIE